MAQGFRGLWVETPWTASFRRLNGSFNHVVVLYYADGNECIGYHKDPSLIHWATGHREDALSKSSKCIAQRTHDLKDKTLDLDENSSIVSISLGRPGRPYVLRDGIFNPTTETEVGLSLS